MMHSKQRIVIVNMLLFFLLLSGCASNQETATKIQKCVDEGRGFVTVTTNVFSPTAIVCI